MAERLVRAAPLLVALVLSVILFAPATLGGKVLSAGDLPLHAPPFDPQAARAEPENELQFDSAYVFEPDGLEVREALRKGRLPLWTRHQSAGRPLLAAQQSAPLYPLTWLGVIFPFFEAQVWIAVMKLVLAAVGAAYLGRALGLGRPAALLAAVSFAFGTYLTDWLLHPHSNAYVLLPLMLLAAERLCRSGSLRAAAALSGLWGLALLSGQPESAFLVGVPTAAWVAWRADSARKRALAVGAALLGIGIGAVMLVPFLEALTQSFDTSRSQSPLPARSMLSLFFPEFWGRPDRLEIAGPSNFTERTLYVGVLPLLLAGAGLAVRRPRGPQLFFAVLAAVSLLVALDTGPVAGAIRGIPGLDALNLNRTLVLAALGLAMLAGFGLQELLDGDRARRRRMLVVASALVALPAIVALAAHPSWLTHLPLGVNRLLGRDNADLPVSLPLASVVRWALAGAVGLAVIAWLALRPGRPTAPAALAVAVVAADLMIVAWGFNPLISPEQAAPPMPAAVKELRGLSAGSRRVTGAGGLTPNTASRWGLEDARGHEQPRVERVSRLWRALGGGLGDGTEAVDAADAGTPRLLDHFGVGAVLTNPLAGASPQVRRRLGGRVVHSGRDGVVIARRDPPPRAFVAYDWGPASDLEASLEAVRGGSPVRPVIEGAVAARGAPVRPTPARVIENGDAEVRVEVDARRAGQLVLLDTYYPGWKAEVNGREAKIRPANGAFRAVAVPKGRSEVSFSYRPASAVVGSVVSLLSLVLLGALSVLDYRRRRWPRH